MKHTENVEGGRKAGVWPPRGHTCDGEGGGAGLMQGCVSTLVSLHTELERRQGMLNATWKAASMLHATQEAASMLHISQEAASMLHISREAASMLLISQEAASSYITRGRKHASCNMNHMCWKC
eukprot:1156504-Pelagomonas_calceolata.AAC.10